MQAGAVYSLSSTDGVHFTEATAQNAFEAEDLTLPASLGGGGVTACRLRSLILLSSDNFAWEVQLFSAHDGPSVDPNKDAFVGRWSFATTDAILIGALYYYYIDGLDVAYRDSDLNQHLGAAVNVPQLHVRLVNRTVTAKTASSAGGHFRLTANLEPMRES